MTEETGLAILEELRKLTTAMTPRERVMPNHPMTPAEFARSIGKHPKTVKRWIGRGMLKVKRVGNSIFITPVAAAKFLGDVSEEER